MNYTVKNKQHDQDNISFFDTKDPKADLPDFLNYEEVLKHSIESNNINDETEIKSICDGGDHLEPYFSGNSAAYECEMYVENTPFIIIENGVVVEKTLEFEADILLYELF